MRLSIIALSLAAASLNFAALNVQARQNNESTTHTVDTAQTESQRLADFFANNFKQRLHRSPQFQSYLGYKWDYDKWNNISETFIEQSSELAKKQLNTLNSFDESQLSSAEKISLALNKVSLERQLANDEFRHHTYIMDQFSAYHTMVPSFLINVHRVTNTEDALAYISRLQRVKTLFSQVIDQLRIRQKMGVFPPKWSYDQMLQASKNVITGAPFDSSDSASSIWQDFQDKASKLEITDSERKTLLNDAKNALLTSVKPAYKALISELEVQRELTPEGDGVWRLPNGDKWYENRLAWFTTTDLTADEVHNIGLQNVERIHQDMRSIMKKVKFDGSLNEFFEFMRSDKQFYYANTDEGRDAYLLEAKALIDTMRDKLPEYFSLIPQAEMVVKRVEPFREKSAGKAFYQSPAKDGSRPGIYYANLYDMNDMPTYQMEALAYHEGIPGHHMQRAIAQELEGIPEFQKYSSFTAYTEGWGLYTEELAKDMGFYQDPYSDFGRLAMELWRACRLVVDTGIHSKKWSREQAINYLIENTPNPKNDSVKAIERYIAMPGQATAYMIGKLKIMELRAWSQAELGEQFDIRGFHAQVLKDGPVPLNILEQKVKAWVADVQQSANKAG
ncbi:hypothetical protein GMES_3009 [Paraglaciecola mesophila KMM 241]|uniref:Lipoprotein n=1 Tax=Paraglaciecola mesophila KMM 241 TaxID=1128912 RepID=K6XXJ6_9ALTE|nr:DUF885 family protein [Paraglaciecola mesophila]GAC25299.1 hypothetical protein GMES_3009 [Paraglaciecola mesophila KMM 241]